MQAAAMGQFREYNKPAASMTALAEHCGLFNPKPVIGGFCCEPKISQAGDREYLPVAYFHTDLMNPVLSSSSI